MTISDELQTPAITREPDADRRALAAGLDLLLYGQTRSGAAQAFVRLRADLRRGTLGLARVRAAAAQVLALKRSLGLDTTP